MSWPKIVAVAGVIVTIVGAVLFAVFKPEPEVTADTANIPTPAVKVEPEKLASQAAAEACRQLALQRLQQMEGGGPEQRERNELEKRWVEYLQRIQSQKDYPNWSGQPCDLYLQNHTRSVGRAMAIGDITVQALGKNLDFVTVTITTTPTIANTTIVVPVGTQFTSSASGTQNMIAAGTVSFRFAQVPQTQSHYLPPERQDIARMGSMVPVSYSAATNPLRKVMLSDERKPQTLTQDVPAYCINRWRDTPSTDTQFKVSESDGTDPLGKLASCLDRKGDAVEHRDKQVAIWLISDQLLDMTRNELAAKLREENESHDTWLRDALINRIAQANPNLGEDEIMARIQAMSENEIADLLRNVTAKEKEKLIAQSAQDNVREFTEVGGPLLESCGYTTSGYRLFQN
jgi:hypothetical protein